MEKPEWAWVQGYRYSIYIPLSLVVGSFSSPLNSFLFARDLGPWTPLLKGLLDRVIPRPSTVSLWMAEDEEGGGAGGGARTICFSSVSVASKSNLERKHLYLSQQCWYFKPINIIQSVCINNVHCTYMKSFIFYS